MYNVITTVIDKHNPAFKKVAQNNERPAQQFIEAIQTIASKPENLNNLQCYLSRHFDEWLRRYASTPETLVCELRKFAEMEI